MSPGCDEIKWFRPFVRPTWFYIVLPACAALGYGDRALPRGRGVCPQRRRVYSKLADGLSALLMNRALAGESDGAKHVLQTLRRLAPGMSQNWIRQNAVWTSADTMKRYVEAFRIAGLK
jgi:hypothetical protein